MLTQPPFLSPFLFTSFREAVKFNIQLPSVFTRRAARVTQQKTECFGWLTAVLWSACDVLPFAGYVEMKPM